MLGRCTIGGSADFIVGLPASACSCERLRVNYARRPDAANPSYPNLSVVANIDIFAPKDSSATLIAFLSETILPQVSVLRRNSPAQELRAQYGSSYEANAAAECVEILCLSVQCNATYPILLATPALLYAILLLACSMKGYS